MASVPRLVQALYLIAALMAGGFAVVLYRKREKRGALPLLLTAVGGTVWALALLGLTLTGRSLAPHLVAVMMLGVVIVPPGVFLFALAYTGREDYIGKPLLVALSIHPVVTMILAVVRPGDLFFTGIKSTYRPAGHVLDTGVLFGVHTAYSYLLVLLTSLVIVEFLVRQRRTIYLSQAAVLLLAITIPVPLNALHVTYNVPLDTTMVGFLATFSLFAIATLSYDFIDITPIAHTTVIDSVRDGMLVVDTSRTIVDSNAATKRIAGMDDEDAIVGEEIDDLFGDRPSIIEEFDALTAEQDETEQTLHYGDRHVNVQAIPLSDSRDRHVGWLFVLQDVTERIQRERDLEHQIERLDQFAGVVSHDLRNPINVANGYVELMQETGTPDRLDETKAALERMEGIVDDALTLAREGEQVTDPEPASVGAISRAAWEAVDTDRARLRVDADPTVQADPDRLQRLLENLFRNSVEHGLPDPNSKGTSTDGGKADDSPADEYAGSAASDRNDTLAATPELTVTVGTEEAHGDECIVYVADDGIGIPDDKLDQIFDDGYSTDPEGTGLGLAIVEQIASAHGWTVDATHSDANGARFEIAAVTVTGESSADR